jgi:hypothetical protein
MKTVDALQKTIHELTVAGQAAAEAKKVKEKARIGKRVAHLKMCVSYLKSDPSEDFIKKERDRVANRINLLLEAWIEPHESVQEKEAKKMKKLYEKDMGIPQLRNQMSVLNFLLN